MDAQQEQGGGDASALRARLSPHVQGAALGAWLIKRGCAKAEDFVSGGRSPGRGLN